MSTVPATPPSAPPAAREPHPADEVRVARIMIAIAAGDRAAIWRLHEVADAPVRSRVRGELRRLGVRYDAHDLDAMVTDAVLAIADIARSWRPGGAPPWSWAHHRVVRVVHHHVGTFADSLEVLGGGDRDRALGWLEPHRDRSLPAGNACITAIDPADAVDEMHTALRRLAAAQPLAGTLDAALSKLASPRDGAVWLAVLDEREAGNRHPAITVGTRFDMRPDAVRKAVQRVWQRVLAATADGPFAALASLPVVAEHRRMAA